MAQLDVAVRCFEENLRLAPPTTQLEKYNLYQGLRILAEALAEIQAALARIEARR